MSELNELYQELVLDHSRQPRNFYKLESADSFAEGFNPLCGDQITVYLRLENDRIKEISFQGSGCAISKAVASMMTAAVKEKTKEEIELLFKKFHRLVTGEQNGSSPTVGKLLENELGKLMVFSGLKDYPVRVKCATLAWHTLRAALENKRENVSIE